MNLILMGFLVVGLPYPPGYSPTVFSPKHAEQRVSLGSPMVKPLAIQQFVPQGFTITNIVIVDGTATLGWQQGLNPFQVWGASSLNGPWNTVGNFLVGQGKTFPVGSNHFWKVQSFVPMLVGHTNSVPKLSWTTPDIMPDQFTAWIVQRRADPPPSSDVNGTDDNGWTQIATVPVDNSLGTLADPYVYDDKDDPSLLPNGTYYYRLKEVTVNGNRIPENVVSIQASSTTYPGTAAWTKRIGGTGTDNSLCVTKDSSNNIYTAGVFQNTVDFGDGSPLTSNGLGDMFITKHDSSGSLVWVKNYHSIGNAVINPKSICLDSTGKIIVSGYWQGGTVNFGGSDFTNGNPNVAGGFIVQVSTTGVHQWSHGYANTQSLQVNSVAVLSNDKIVGIGFYQGSITISGVSLSNFGLQRMFLAKWNNDGSDNTCTDFTPSAGGVLGVSVCIDASDNVFFVGKNNGTVTFGATTINGGGPFLVKTDSSFTVIWARSFAINTSGQVGQVTLDSSGNPIICGSFYKVTDLNPGPPPGNVTGMQVTGSAINYTGFIEKFSKTDGSYVWSYLTVGGNNVGFNSIAVDQASGNVNAVGIFVGTLVIGPSTITNMGLALNAFMVGFDSNANPRWATSFGDQINTSGALSVAISANGRVLVCGQFIGAAYGYTSINGSQDAILLSVNP